MSIAVVNLMDVEHLLAGRPLALDRTALPALASAAAVRAGASLEQVARQHAVLPDGRDSGGPVVRRLGSIAVVPLFGLITPDPFLAWLTSGTTPDGLVRALRDVVADSDVTSVILLVDSPGGEVSLLTETAAEVRRLRAIKPIASIARMQMASGAYWLGSQASPVYGTPSADVGGVGVFTIHVDQSRFNDRVGITPTYISSSVQKVETNPDQPLADDARAYLQSRVDVAYQTFIRDVAAGRGIGEGQVRTRFGEGRSFDAVNAEARGLIDSVSTLDAVLTSLVGTRSGRSARVSLSQADADALAIIIALSGSS